MGSPFVALFAPSGNIGASVVERSEVIQSKIDNLANLATFRDAARSLSVSPELRERIMSCTDVVTLDKWLARAVTAQSASEALSEA
jgi:hypothetical protein